jgi:hypothetical protein
VPDEEADPLDDLRQPFVRWFDSRVSLDARALALRLPPTWSTAVSALHRDCRQWVLEHSPVVPPTETEFTVLLRELGCSIHTTHGCELVDHVALKEDAAAVETFRRSEPEPAPRASLAPAHPVAITDPDPAPLLFPEEAINE